MIKNSNYNVKVRKLQLFQLFRIAFDYFTSHGMKKLVSTLLESFYLSSEFKIKILNNKNLLSQNQKKWIKSEIEISLVGEALDLDSEFKRLTRPYFRAVPKGETFIIKAFVEKINSLSHVPKNLHLAAKCKEQRNLDFDKFDFYVCTKRCRNSSNNHFSFSEILPVASVETRMRSLLIICFMDKFNSFTFKIDNFNEAFLSRYQKILDHADIQISKK